jgi:hypothetical protein
MYMVHMQGAKKRIMREHEQAAWVAWHTAYLPRTKKPIGLDKLIKGEAAQAQPKPWQHQLAAWKAYANYSRGK